MILRNVWEFFLLLGEFVTFITVSGGQDPYAEGRNMEPDTRSSSFSSVRYHYFPKVNRNLNRPANPPPDIGRSVGYYWDGNRYQYFHNSLASDFGQDYDFNWGTAPLLKNNVGTGDPDKAAADNATITDKDAKAKLGNSTSDTKSPSDGQTTTSNPQSKTGKIETTSPSTKSISNSTTTIPTTVPSSTVTTEPSTTATATATTTLATTTVTVLTPTESTTTPITTPTTTTGSTTMMPTTATTTTASSTVPPTVPARDLSSARCTPKNAPTIGKNGVCSSTADLSRNCGSLQITTSTDCSDFPGKWCCYSGNTKPAAAPGFVKCSPDSLPSVGRNGRCTTTENLASHCLNLDIAASAKDCGDFDGKWCCYLPPDDHAPIDSCSTKGPYSAQVVLEKNEIKGTLRFEQATAGAPTKVTGLINGLPPNSLLGIVVHSVGDTTDGCGNIGDHYNPQNLTHGELSSPIRHAGDLGNIQSDSNGVATVNLSSSKLQLVGPWSVVGRSLAVHAGRDGGGGGSDDSLLTGNVGSPILCGIIGQRTL